MLPLLLRDLGLLTSLGRLGPGLRQKESKIHQRRFFAQPQTSKDPHLAILLLAQPPAILSLDSHGVVPLFGEAAFVDQQGAVAVSPEQTVDLAGHLGHQFVLRPGRVAHELLHGLIITFGDVAMNALQVLAPVSSQQAGQVIRGVLADVLAANQEMFRVIRHEAKKAFSNAAQALESIFSWRGFCRALRFIFFGILCRRFCSPTTND